MNARSSTFRVIRQASRLLIAIIAARTLLLQAASIPMLLPKDPALSADGSTIAFAWRGDVWSVSSAGGVATQLTRDPARDGQPAFSPDGTEIAFVSDRSGSRQVHVMPVGGGVPRRITTHTEGFTLEEWMPDGKSLLVSIQRDHFWRRGERFSVISKDVETAESVIFDDYGANGAVSPDGRFLLFNREGERWWRKGYAGSRSSQVWLFDREKGGFKKLIATEHETWWPMWKPDGKSFYYVGQQDGTLNLYERSISGGRDRQLTRFKDDGVTFPAISRDGSTIVFRVLSDLYVVHPGRDEPPVKLHIQAPADVTLTQEDRRVLSKADAVTFTKDGLEMAFIAGGDVWVMDTELREPRQITNTPEEESEPSFSPDGRSLLFVSRQGGQCDIWKATRGDDKKYWWQNDSFKLQPLTRDIEAEQGVSWSPDGSRIAFTRIRGDFWTMKPDGSDAKMIFSSWDQPDYDWSPDGRWIVYAVNDNDFNQDVWIRSLEDDNARPFNLSRHPDNEYRPVWSPDGKAIAFTGRRVDKEIDIHYVWLKKEDEDKSRRDRTLAKALEKMTKARSTKTTPKAPSKAEEGKAADTRKGEGEKPADEKVTKVEIDFEDIHERIHRVSLAKATPSRLFWSHDSKKLAFSATIDGKEGTYTIDLPENTKPSLLVDKTGTHAAWVKEGNQILWLVGGQPSAFSNGRLTSYTFKARQRVDMPGKFRAAFDLSWQSMRDHFYDDNLGNRNWNAVRAKYRDLAGSVPDGDALEDVVNMMLGELNGSHLGFNYSNPEARTPATQWNETTMHPGVRFDPAFGGPGLKVRDVLPKGPAQQVSSRIQPGEIILSIDGTKVDATTPLAPLLTLQEERDLRLEVAAAPGAKPRVMHLRPVSYSAARTLLYEQWIRHNRQAVEKASDGRLGYLHIAGMNMASFNRFEEELYSVGAGKDGIVIDVRENGGGSTTDHLLTALTQPRHAITVPRGGGPGYPNDRMVYATWHKPIVVMCNQNSYSNAEIFSHAIQTLKRGKLVGVPTAGGVISTGARSIMDMGSLRMPFRGWYGIKDGEDMELHPPVPDFVLWPEPGEMPAGVDRQLQKAIDVLSGEVKAWSRIKTPALKKASERR